MVSMLLRSMIFNALVYNLGIDQDSNRQGRVDAQITVLARWLKLVLSATVARQSSKEDRDDKVTSQVRVIALSPSTFVMLSRQQLPAFSWVKISSYKYMKRRLV
jgi:hypothetical protein